VAIESGLTLTHVAAPVHTPSVETERQRAIELARLILDGAGETEEEADELIKEFESLVPDPNASALIFWPEAHALSRELTPEQLTPERIVDLAYRYKPFAL
jgi:hypothetical protein